MLLANEVAKPVTEPVFWTAAGAALDGAADEATWFGVTGAALDGAADEAAWLDAAGATLDGAADEATWLVAAGALDDGATDEAALCCWFCGADELAAWLACVVAGALLATEAELL